MATLFGHNQLHYDSMGYGMIELLSKVSSEAWTALGVALFAFIGVWWTGRSNYRQLELRLSHEDAQLKMRLVHEDRVRLQQIKRERLEELYTKLSQWETENIKMDIQLSLLLTNAINLDQYTENMSVFSTERTDFSRIVMLGGIYGHSFQSVLDGLIEINRELSMFLAQCLLLHTQSQINQSHRNEFSSMPPRRGAAVEALKKEIVKAAKEIEIL